MYINKATYDITPTTIPTIDTSKNSNKEYARVQLYFTRVYKLENVLQVDAV